MTRCVTDWAALLYGCRESLPWPGGCGEGTEVVNWDLLEKPNDCIVILTLSSSHRIARKFHSTPHAFTAESNPVPLWRQRQKAKWISAEVTTEWTSSSLPLSEEAKAETKSGRHLKQYLVSEGILNDCGKGWVPEVNVKVLTGESKAFDFGGLPMRYFRGEWGIWGTQQHKCFWGWVITSWE